MANLQTPLTDWPSEEAERKVAIRGLIHWSVPADLAMEYVDKFGWKKAFDLDMEASEGFTDGGLKSPRNWVRKIVNDELLVV